jgi:hypothetical protein
VRRLLIVLFLAAGGVVASVAFSAPSNRVACQARAIDVYFWPAGHEAIPGFGPRYRPAHLEIYTARNAKPSGFLGFVGATGASFARSCRAVGDAATTRAAGTTVNRRKKVRCTFLQNVELKVVPSRPAGRQLLVTVGHTPLGLVSAVIKTRGSTLTFDRRFCRSVPLPAGA